MRELFVRTDGKINDSFSFFSQLRKAKKTKYPNKLLKDINSSEIENIVNNLDVKGFYILDQKLPEEYVEEIIQQARTTPISYVIPQNEKKTLKIEHADKKLLFDSVNPISPRYFFTMNEILDFKLLQELLFEPLFLQIAQKYLKCEPVLDLFAMWWSAPFHNKATSETAQEYHFDMDKLKFLKFFIYLSDVDSQNGPHMYVEGSHKSLDKKFLKDQRFSDEDIENSFDPKLVHELTAKKGTIIVADTRGLHKGQALMKGERLIFQIEFSNNLFGMQYSDINCDKVNVKYNQKISNNPYAYQLFKGV